VISDVDGTLVTPDKQITEASVGAVRLLCERGIAFTVVSSRPPTGLRMLAEPLGLRLPMGAFSGGAIVNPDLSVIEQHFVPETAARRSADVLAAFGADIWLYTAAGWLIRNPDGHYVMVERKTLQADPMIVQDFGPHFVHTFKIVGSSQDFSRLAECEVAMRDAIGEHAFVARSQPYYLDITPPGVDKGTFLKFLSKWLAIPPRAIAVLGDMGNDLAMFRKAGVSIAMGNASAEVKGCAKYVTRSNTEEGFARAIEQYVLGAVL
jgi:hypothetical protein